MGQAALNLPMSGLEFLAWETTQPERHEYWRGEVFAMAGADEAHGTVAGNLYVVLRQHLAGGPCRTFMTDMKLHVRAASAYFYPDLMVTCRPGDAADPLIKREPVLLVEVLSRSTAAFDRGDKFAAYRQLPSLRELLLIDPDSRRSDLYRLGPEGRWVLHPSEPDEGVTLDSVALEIAGSALWAEVPRRSARPDAA
jgi:Uma2 family endonuclease